MKKIVYITLPFCWFCSSLLVTVKRTNRPARRVAGISLGRQLPENDVSTRATRATDGHDSRTDR